MYKKTVVNAASERPLPVVATTERKEVKAGRKEKTFMTMVEEQQLGKGFLCKRSECSMLLQK